MKMKTADMSDEFTVVEFPSTGYGYVFRGLGIILEGPLSQKGGGTDIGSYIRGIEATGAEVVCVEKELRERPMADVVEKDVLPEISERLDRKKRFVSLGYATGEPCAVCGGKPTRSEPRSGHAVCIDHCHLSPAEIVDGCCS